MIVYKATTNEQSVAGNYWRIPRSVAKNNSGTWVFADSVRKNNGSAWDLSWHRNQAAFSTVGSTHPFWQYSMNPNFNISENNYFGLFGEMEISFDTGLSNPNQSGRYTAGAGVGTIYATQKSAANACDCILKSKFPLNIPNGGKYRSQVVVSSRTPSNENFGILPARYYRLIIDKIRNQSIQNLVQLSEFRLFDNNGTSLSPTYSGTGGYPAGEEPPKAGDGSLDTKWLDGTGVNSILYMTFPANTAISGYRFATANDADHRDPVSWRLQASTNNSTWTTIATVTDWNTSTSRKAWEPDFFLQPTILTGFFSAATFEGADFKGSGATTEWGPRIDIGRSTSFSQSGTHAYGGAWDFNYFTSTKTLNYDTYFPSGDVWIRPIIKIESQSTNAVPVSYVLNSWTISRLA